MKDLRATNAYRSDIEGLRGVAVLAIVAFDYKVPLLRGGFVGVDVSFVLSGFLICALVYGQLRHRTFDLADFYLGRLRRIMPALFLVILFCLVLGCFVLSPWEVYRLGQSAVAASLSASNFLYLIRGSFFSERAITQPLLMTWPLGVAMQFYVVLPLLLIALKNRAPRTTFVVMAAISGMSFSASVFAEYRQHVWNFYLPFTRAWEFGAGSLLALWRAEQPISRIEGRWGREWLGVAGAFMLLTSVFAYRPEMRFPGFEALLPVAGAVLLLAAEKSRIHRLLSSRWLVGVGLISYSLYLWHWPLLSYAEICSARPLHPLTRLLVLALSVVASLFSFFLVERRYRRGRQQAGKRALLSYAVAITVMTVIAGSLYVSKGLPSRSPTLYGLESRAALYRHYPCISSGSYLRLSAQCAPAPSATEPGMAVLGGGHAEAFAEGLRDFLHSQGWQLITLTRESCPPTLGVSQWGAADSTLADSCRRFNRAALDYILARADVRAVVLVGRWRADYVPDDHQGNPAKDTIDQNAMYLRSGLASEVNVLESKGKHVIVLEDTPEFPYDPVAAIRTRYLPFRRALNRFLFSDQPEQGDGSTELRSIAVPAGEQRVTDQILAVKAADPRLLLVDPKGVLCHGDRCSFAEGSNLFFFDSIHLSRTGAMQILPLFPDLRTLR